MEAREIAKLAVEALEDKKAQDIKVIDICSMIQKESGEMEK